MMQRIVIAETRNGAVSRRFVEFDANAKKPNDSTRCNQPRSVQTPRTNLRLRRNLLWTPAFRHRPVNHPAHHATHKDGQRRSNTQISSNRKRKRSNAQQFDNDYDGNSEQHKRPRQLAAEDSVDDSSHQTALRRRGLLASYALNPLDFDLAGCGTVKIFAVIKSCGADGVEEDVLFCVGDLFFDGVVGVVRGKSDSVAAGEVAVILNAVGEMVECEGDRFGEALEGFEAFVHGVQRSPNGKDRNNHANHNGELLLPRRSPNQVARFEILRGIASVRGRDTNNPADGDGKRAKRGRRPAFDEEDRSGGHQRSDGHSRDRRRRTADDADDSRAHRHEEKAEYDNKQRRRKIGKRSDLRSWNRFELKEEKHQQNK